MLATHALGVMSPVAWQQPKPITAKAHQRHGRARMRIRTPRLSAVTPLRRHLEYGSRNICRLTLPCLRHSQAPHCGFSVPLDEPCSLSGRDCHPHSEQKRFLIVLKRFASAAERDIVKEIHWMTPGERNACASLHLAFGTCRKSFFCRTKSTLSTVGNVQFVRVLQSK